jgi:hypothetical protein
MTETSHRVTHSSKNQCTDRPDRLQDYLADQFRKEGL